MDEVEKFIAYCKVDAATWLGNQKSFDQAAAKGLMNACLKLIEDWYADYKTKIK